jgi:hypothetical protein
MAVQTQIQTRRGTAASWTSTNPTLAAGEIGFESDTGKIKIGTGSTAWNALTYTASSTAVTYLFNATAAQTTFSGADANGLTLAYTVGSEQVYLNGVLQVRGSDYTATNGTSIVLASGAVVSDVLNVIAFSALALSDTYTQAQADAKFFQTANAFLAGKNKIINGDFGIWQRGTTFNSVVSGQYTADRWAGLFINGTINVTRQAFTPGTAPVAGYESSYFVRMARTSTAAITDYFGQNIEDVRTFAGQTVTLSVWAKGSSAFTVQAYFDQNFGSGGSTTVGSSAGTFNLTTSWQRFTFSVTLASIAGKTIGTNNMLQTVFTFPTGAGNVSLDLWGLQVEAGSVATPFQTATGTLAGELAACQRYYYRIENEATGSFTAITGVASTATLATFLITPKVTMRIKPTSVEAISLRVYDYVNAAVAITAATVGAGSTNGWALETTTTGNSQYRSYTIIGNTLPSYLAFSAEL